MSFYHFKEDISKRIREHMKASGTQHYNAEYFNWQKGMGNFGGWANLIKFQDFITAEDNVVDFGCGGAFLLKNLNCKGKMGVEINPSAREQAKINGITAVASPSELPDDWATVCISNNALEHVINPLEALQTIHSKMKKGGTVVFVVPCENISWAYKPNDMNYHLYSWGPMTLGNLFTEAGFKIVESKPFVHKWPPKYEAVAKFLGPKLFHLACRLYGQYERTWFQVRVVAKKQD
jgi:SAM-dependent methyltransferase